MRIISGIARGLKLKTPEGRNTRPIPDRLKESLFNILYSRDALGAVRWCDFFCGAGSIGLEALSRGAAQCVFVDNDRDAFRCLTSNLKKSRLDDRARPYRTDMELALIKLARAGETFHIISLDPPFDMFNEWLRWRDSEPDESDQPDRERPVDAGDPFEGLDDIDELDLIQDDTGRWVPNPDQPDVAAARKARRRTNSPARESGVKFDRIFRSAFEILDDSGMIILRGESRKGVSFDVPDGFGVEARRYGRNTFYLIRKDATEGVE